jgi:predicted CXXCH cytochrome family protein
LDPRSSIARGNIAQTCLKCHSQIEQVHRKIIKGELWEKNPQSIPACVDCHQPHKARKIFYEQGIANKDCLTCHSDKNLTSSKDHRSLFVDSQQTTQSIHAQISCAQCHTDVSVSRVRACETIKNKVDCSICHSQQTELYQQGIHGQLFQEGNPNAPSCIECHGTHATLSHKNLKSPTYPTNVPTLCARCHRENGKAALLYKGTEHNIKTNYVESIHGKGLLKSGLVVTATCTSCHTAHKQLSASDPESSVNRNNIAATCSQCHKGVYEKYINSVHAIGKSKSSKLLPACNDCHSAHTIKRTDVSDFKFEIMDKCGKCHKDISETYFQTVHGKAANLGYTKSAKCHDCHGSHEIRSVTDPQSTLSREHIVITCQKCHTGATKRFAGYLTHATHHDPQKYPWVFWTFWFMTSLLVGTFTMSLFHTLLWLPKSLQMRRLHPPKPYPLSEKQYVRFPVFYRILHIIMIISFLTLTVTGMTLKFSYTPWALLLSKILGGFEVSGFLHRCAAMTLFGLFIAHFWHLIFLKKSESKSWKELIFGPDSILFSKKDWQEFLASMKWYTGKGPYPRYGRWTYWEKFDYFAVLWGIMVIGTSGLMLWFPEIFTHVLPGWVINVATIIHSDEALLAAGFIFTIHFFNTHFRPEKFPMDTVIFTGRMSLEELKRERPAEYETLLASGKLEENMAEPMSERRILAIKIFGWTALTIGLVLVVCIIYTMIFAYK